MISSIAPNAQYDVVNGKPAALESYHDGSFVFRVNVSPLHEVQNHMQSEEPVAEADIPQSGWSCFEVRGWGTPTKAGVKKAFIRTIMDETTEFDLVNSYNKHILGIKEDPAAVERYKDFLRLTEELDSVLVDVFNP